MTGDDQISYAEAHRQRDAEERARIEAIQQEADRLSRTLATARDALNHAWSDIGRWIQLATYQRQKMDQNLGWCPTEAGIEQSHRVRDRITAALQATQESYVAPRIEPIHITPDGRVLRENGEEVSGLDPERVKQGLMDAEEGRTTPLREVIKRRNSESVKAMLEEILSDPGLTQEVLRQLRAEKETG
jgi:hypothetical protein